jgi:uncharacterized protein
MKAYKSTPITHMSLLVTLACNLRCVYCYEDKTGAKMDEKTAFKAVDWLIKNSENMKIIRIVFFGGEPLLNFPLIKSVVAYAKDKTQKEGKKATFAITTNGTLLDDDIISFLEEHKINALLSFDGTKELQDNQRPYASGKGSYDTIVPKIKKLLEVAPQTTGHSVIMGNTSPEIVKDALQEIGFSRVSAIMNSQSLFTKEEEEKGLIRNTERTFHVLEEEREVWSKLIKAQDISSLKRLVGRSNLYGALLSALNNSKKTYFCGAGRSMVSVTPSGDIYLCHRFVGLDEYKIGSLDSNQLELNDFSQSPVETNSICKECSARYYCGGGCKHDHVSATRNINIPEENMCNIKRHELKQAMSIVEDLSPEEKSWLIKERIFPPKPCPLDL